MHISIRSLICVFYSLKLKLKLFTNQFYIMQPNFQVSGSRTKLYSASHTKTGPIAPSAKTTKLITLLKGPVASVEDEISHLDSFIAEHKDEKEFKQQYFRTIFYHALANRLCLPDWLSNATPIHILRVFQCCRLLAREPTLLVFFLIF